LNLSKKYLYGCINSLLDKYLDQPAQRAHGKDTTMTKDQEPISDVRKAFELWCELHRPATVGTKRQPKLDDKRELLIKKAIAAYDPETVEAAIRGCAISEFHQGKNPRNRKYDDIELILRDAKHIEDFAALWDAYEASDDKVADGIRKEDTAW